MSRKAIEDLERLRFIDDDTQEPAVRTINQSSLVPSKYDYMALTYVAAGNDAAGEIETVTYKTGGASGTEVAVLTLSYNSDCKITSVVRT